MSAYCGSRCKSNSDIYRQIELTTLSLDELEHLSPQEYDNAITCRVAARKAGFLKFD